ncbi:hypothetical protein LTR53_012521 [Teratosphaeriaceae sp. CCFEE 6253]|nr:hypothetical protein LTR53_012521 [Teratosphaeriaceae sp. CCFEE 6253]
MYLGIVNTGYATSFFTPTILVELGYKAEKAQVRSIPIFLVAACVCGATAWFSDRLRHRYAFAITGICIATIGYVVLLCQASVPANGRYAAVFLIVSGGYMCQPITLGWINNTMGGHYKRSISSAFQVGFGDMGGIVASNNFITGQAPRYPVGYGVSLALIRVTALSCTGLLVGLMKENRKRERGERDWRLDGPDADNLGDGGRNLLLFDSSTPSKTTDLDFFSREPPNHATNDAQVEPQAEAAATAGDLEILKRVLESVRGVSGGPTTALPVGSALFLAVQHGRTEIVEYFVNEGWTGHTTYAKVAIVNGDTAMLEPLLKHGWHINTLMEWCLLSALAYVTTEHFPRKKSSLSWTDAEDGATGATLSVGSRIRIASSRRDVCGGVRTERAQLHNVGRLGLVQEAYTCSCGSAFHPTV